MKCLFLIFALFVLINFVSINRLITSGLFTSHNCSSLHVIRGEERCRLHLGSWEACGFCDAWNVGVARVRQKLGTGTLTLGAPAPANQGKVGGTVQADTGKSMGTWPASHGMLDKEQGWRTVTAN